MVSYIVACYRLLFPWFLSKLGGQRMCASYIRDRNFEWFAKWHPRDPRERETNGLNWTKSETEGWSKNEEKRWELSKNTFPRMIFQLSLWLGNKTNIAVILIKQNVSRQEKNHFPGVFDQPWLRSPPVGLSFLQKIFLKVLLGLKEFICSCWLFRE